MTQPTALSHRPQLALQSYLDDLLFDATEALLQVEPPAPELDEFAVAALEEQVRDARAEALARPAQHPQSRKNRRPVTPLRLALPVGFAEMS